MGFAKYGGGCDRCCIEREEKGNADGWTSKRTNLVWVKANATTVICGWENVQKLCMCVSANLSTFPFFIPLYGDFFWARCMSWMNIKSLVLVYFALNSSSCFFVSICFVLGRRVRFIHSTIIPCLQALTGLDFLSLGFSLDCSPRVPFTLFIGERRKIKWRRKADPSISCAYIFWVSIASCRPYPPCAFVYIFTLQFIFYAILIIFFVCEWLRQWCKGIRL